MLTQSVLLVALIVGFQEAKTAANVAGIWEGTLELGAIKMRLAFKIEKKPDGTFASKMDSPDQGAKDIAMDETTFDGKTLTMEFKKGGAKFAGEMAADGQLIKGKWKQSGHEFDLDLKKVEKLTEVKRPQLPKKPYPYHDEEVTFENPDAKVKIAGTFTKPKDGGPHPAVVLITGSGPQDRDESILGHQPFLVVADHLTRQGIAVLRCDDRGVGKSTGKHSTATSADFATDVVAAVRFLKSRADVDPQRIGLAGHSEGGMIAPMVAAGHPDDVAFIVLLAGTGLPGDEILRDQLVAILKAKGIKYDDIKLQLGMQRKLISVTKEGGESKELAKKLAAAAREYLASLSADERKVVEALSGLQAKPDKPGEKAKAGNPSEKAKADDPEEKAYLRLANPWMIYFLNYDPRPTLLKVQCPVLALNGELDLQVTPKENLAALAEAFRAGRNSRVELVELKGLNHLFQHCKTGDPGEYGTIEETFAPEALKLMADWINKTVKRP